jgi:DNA replication and repair protein RecF
MLLETLRIERLRALASVAIDLAPGLNLFTGGNGAGKTSVLEAVHLLSHARSFREGSRDALIQRGASELTVFGLVRRGGGQRHRLGLRRTAIGSEGRIDEQPAPNLGALLRHCAVICFEPGSHALISGASEGRRRFLDWLLFHVEPGFLEVWRAYQRALRQRNAALRVRADDATLGAWECAMAEAGSLLATQRETWIARLEPGVAALASALLPELGTPMLRQQSGWSREQSLQEALEQARPRDRVLGHSRRGPHRADWSLGFERAPDRAHLSRGQEKAAALVCLLALARLYGECLGEPPIFLLDDFASELDAAHQERVAAELARLGGQVLVTGVEAPCALADWPAPRRSFHVEQGRVQRVEG